MSQVFPSWFRGHWHCCWRCLRATLDIPGREHLHQFGYRDTLWIVRKLLAQKTKTLNCLADATERRTMPLTSVHSCFLVPGLGSYWWPCHSLPTSRLESRRFWLSWGCVSHPQAPPSCLPPRGPRRTPEGLSCLSLSLRSSLPSSPGKSHLPGSSTNVLHLGALPRGKYEA